jgi:hypothetical protein
MRDRPEGQLGHGRAARSSRGGDPCAARAPGALAVWSPRPGRRGGALIGGPMVASRQQGVVGELVGTTGRALGNESGGGDHPNSGTSVG